MGLKCFFFCYFTLFWVFPWFVLRKMWQVVETLQQQWTAKFGAVTWIIIKNDDSNRPVSSRPKDTYRANLELCARCDDEWLSEYVFKYMMVQWHKRHKQNIENAIFLHVSHNEMRPRKALHRKTKSCPTSCWKYSSEANKKLKCTSAQMWQISFSSHELPLF